MNSDIINNATNALASTQHWGVIPITIFFVLLILAVTGFFIYFLLVKIAIVIDKNSSSNTELIKTLEQNTLITKQYTTFNEKILNSLTNSMDRVLNSQEHIHKDVKDILQITSSRRSDV